MTKQSSCDWPERPHPPPCACETCAAWAQDLVAAFAERNPSPTGTWALAAEMPLADFMRGVVAIACKATGLTEAQLRKRGEQIGADMPDPEPRATRATVAARGVPEIHLRAVYDATPVECEALAAVRAFVEDPQKSTLVLAGGVGLRKTGSACWALTQKPGVFLTADECLRLAASSRVPEDVEAWRRARNAQVLVVDDLGGEFSDDKGWSVKVFNGLLDHRYSSGLKTLITTNLERQRFVSDYGERVADRIRESGRWLTLGGVSVRRAS